MDKEWTKNEQRMDTERTWKINKKPTKTILLIFYWYSSRINVQNGHRMDKEWTNDGQRMDSEWSQNGHRKYMKNQ